MKYLKIFSIALLVPFFSMGQETGNGVTWSLGNASLQQSIDQPTSFKVSRSDLDGNAQLHVGTKAQEYTITSYKMSVLSKSTGEVIEYKRQNSDILKDITYTLAPGDRVYIEELKADCEGCKNPVTAKPIAILIQ